MSSTNLDCPHGPAAAIVEGTLEQINAWVALVRQHAAATIGWRYHGPGRGLVCYLGCGNDREQEARIGGTVREAMEAYQDEIKIVWWA